MALGPDQMLAHYRLVEQIGDRLRRRRRAARRVAVILDYSDGRRCARQMAARPATANANVFMSLPRCSVRSSGNIGRNDGAISNFGKSFGPTSRCGKTRTLDQTNVLKS